MFIGLVGKPYSWLMLAALHSVLPANTLALDDLAEATNEYTKKLWQSTYSFFVF